MAQIGKEVFVCIDCETTGLDAEHDRIIEIALARFNFHEIIQQYETLLNPEYEISERSLSIHKIQPEMLIGKPKIEEVLPFILDFIGNHIIIGHSVGFDIQLLVNAAKRNNLPCNLLARPYVDTLRLARLYGESQTNSLEKLGIHFNVPSEGAHRALNDVLLNIRVFKHLARRFQTTVEVLDVLSRPIRMKAMPLGRHKGRPFSEVPLQYLQKAAGMSYDQDLLYSIRYEINRRKKGKGFQETSNPFLNLGEIS